MSEHGTEAPADALEQEYDLDAAPEKVWRAISDETYRDRWLPGDALAEPDAVSAIPQREIRYRMRDDEPPFLESVVTFRISPNDDGGTRLRIIHEITGTGADDLVNAANGNNPMLMRAA